MKIKENIHSAMRYAGRALLNTYIDFHKLQKEKRPYLEQITDLRTWQFVAQNTLLAHVAAFAISGVASAVPSKQTLMNNFANAASEVGNVLQGSGIIARYEYPSSASAVRNTKLGGGQPSGSTLAP